MASASGSTSSSGKPAGFMSEYMSDLGQSQDLNSFLQKNQPAYDPNSHPSSSTSAAPGPTSSSSSSTSSPSSSSAKDTHTNKDSFSSTSTSTARKPFDAQTPVGSHPLPNAHSIYQKKAIQNAALDNCADINLELTDCLMGKAGTWWDRASMCMKAKEQLQQCCRLNREILQERGYAKEGNTAQQDRAIMDYADEHAQKAMKEGKKA